MLWGYSKMACSGEGYSESKFMWPVQVLCKTKSKFIWQSRFAMNVDASFFPRCLLVMASVQAGFGTEEKPAECKQQ